MEISEFLAARLDEDEAAARYCSPGPWQASPRGLYVDDAKGDRLAVVNFTEDGRHIARYDPARVLRDVEAKRAILAEYEGWGARSPVSATGGQAASPIAVGTLRLVLCHLVAEFGDHPDYQQDWKP